MLGFTQIDWNKEVAQTPIPKEGDHKPMSYAMKAYIEIKDMLFLDLFDDEKEDYEKSNSLRMMEYFYAKWLFLHHHFYKKISKNSLKDIEADSLEGGQKIDLPKSDLPIEKIHELEKTLYGIFERSDKKRESETEKEYPKLVKHFKRRELEVTRPDHWRTSGDRDAFQTTHDGVPYIFEVMRGDMKSRKKQIDERVERHNIFISQYHLLQKRIFKHLSTKVIDGSVMEGGGSQLQSFFSDPNGYIAILYLKGVGKKIKDTDVYTLQMQRDVDWFDDLDLKQVKVEKRWFEEVEN